MSSHKSPRTLLLLMGIAVMLTAVILSGCSQAAPQQAPAPAAESGEAAAEAPAQEEAAAPAEEAASGSAVDEYEGELTLAIWGQIDADPQHAAYAYHEILQQWNEMHPNIDLKYELIGGSSVPERFTWIKTHMLAGTLPDVVMIYFPSDDFRDPELLYDFTEDLQKPNPYSDNPTWWDDFPYDGLILKSYAGPNGEYFFMGPTLKGDSGVTTFIYNKDIFDEVGVEPPETWAEFMDISQKIKDAGYTPFFQPVAGPLGWLIDWPFYAMSDQFMDEVIRECDFEEPKDSLSQKEMAYCVETGRFRADDPRYMETYRLIKEWSPYWQEGFLAPPPEGDPFVQGKAAMQHMMNLWLNRIANNPNVTFEWGTFYQPPVTKDSSDLIEKVFIRRVGNQGAPASGSQFLMVPLTTVENGKLDVARDLLQYTTAPEQLEYWCERQPIPCFEPGTPIEEVFPDQPEKWVQLRGFFEPGAFENGIRNFTIDTFGHDAGSLARKVLQDYLGDALTLEEAMEEIQMIMEEETEKAIREHPEWNADEWQ